MKNVIISVILVAMLGWAIYEANSKSEKVQGLASDETETPLSVNEFKQQESNEETVATTVQGDWLETGKKVPDFTLHTLEGKEVTLSDYRGEKVLINFWATWCPPCRAEMPDMQEFYERHDVNILAVNLTQSEASLNDVESFVKEYNLTFPILLDKNMDVSNNYSIQPIPTSFFIDEEGVLQSIRLGAMTYDYMLDEWNDMDNK